ncbi:MAG: RHS repeat-associated core domain-containing protein [Myxococcaceae bacterium]
MTDPDTGSFLNYYSNGNPQVPQQGFQIPVDAANQDKLYVNASNQDGGISSLILFTPSNHYYYAEWDGAHTYYLSRVEDIKYTAVDSGVTVANISYSSPGVISSVTTADGVVLVFNNTGGNLQSVSIDGGTVAAYTYSNGLLNTVTYDDGTGEEYAYGTNSNGFAATTLTGRKIISYVIDAGSGAGEGAVSSQTTEETTLSLLGWWNDTAYSCSGGSGTDYCYQNTLSDPAVTAGDGTWSVADLQTAYTLSVPTNASVGTGRQTSLVTRFCSGSCSGLLASSGQAWWFWPGVNYAYGQSAGNQPYAQSSMSENNAFTAYPNVRYAPSSVVPSDAGFLPPPEYPTILSGATNDGGAGAVSTQTRAYVYGGVGQPVQGYEQMVSTVQKPSPLGGNTTTYYNWDTTNNRLNSVVRVGQTAIDSSMSLSQQNIGTIYSYDSRGRVLSVQGPCFVASATQPTGCASSNSPAVVYTYYPPSGTGFTANRANTKTVCTGPLSGTPPNQTCPGLTTTYKSYDARGHVTDSVDANLVETISTYSGNLLLSTKVTATTVTDTTNYGYDGDQLQWVQHPTGMVDFTCYRVQAPNTPPGNCSTTLTASKFVYWKAKCSDTACTHRTESVAYQYLHGYVSQETYYDSMGQVRRVVRHDRDPRNRPTFDAVGDLSDTTDTTYSTRAMFDNDGNQISVGFPYNAPSVFCKQGGDTTTCAEMVPDGLDRLAKLTEPLVNAGASQEVVAYDSLGHVSSITYNSQKVIYGYDDFGNLLTVQAPWLANGGVGIIRYAYDAQGHIVIKETPAMAASGAEFLQYDYDVLGRPLDLKHYLSGYTTLWALAYDTPGGACPPQSSGAFTMGRVQMRTDSFGQTYYTYNFRGQVTAELRVRNGTSCTALPVLPLGLSCEAPSDDNHLNTVYDYGSTGVLNNIQYPHGRVVRFGYPSFNGDLEQPGSVSADVLNGSSCATVALLSYITWEPYGGVRGYQVSSPTASTTLGAVEYLLGDASTVATLTSCPASRPSSSNSDHSGRLRALWVSTGGYTPSSPTGTGNIFARQYTWRGDQLVTQASCVLQSAGTPVTENFFSSGGVAGYNARLQLEHASRPSGGMKATGGAWGERDYSYDLRGNRLTETTDCWSWAEKYDTLNPLDDQLMSRAVTGSSCSATCQGFPFLTTNYSYDADGRMATLTTASDSVGPPLSLSFNASIDGQAAVGAVYKAITVNGSTYEYYYDADGRRRLKAYPDGEQDEYFYGPSDEIIEDHENCAGCVPSSNTLDEYVWLGGHPAILFRGSLNASGGRNPDFSGTCADTGNCGVYFPVTDYLGKPVLLLDSGLLVAGAADYDPFGHVNRVTAAGDTPHPYLASPVNPQTGAPESQVVAGFRQTVPVNASYSVIARARLAMVDTDSSASAYASLTDLGVSTLQQYPAGSGTVPAVGGPHYGATVTGWAFVPNGTSSWPGQLQVRFTATGASTSNPPRSGIAVAGYEYRKYQSGSAPTWLPLRFPGQYYDAETDLFQNWNRFYDSNTGRYLEPEPTWQSAESVLRAANKGMSLPVYAYAGGNPITHIDATGLDTVLIFFTSSIGDSHVALYVTNGLDGHPTLFDPGGSYVQRFGGGSQWIFTGSQASWQGYVNYWQRQGSSPHPMIFFTSPKEEAQIASNFQTLYPNNPGPGLCAVSVSSCLQGVPTFSGLGTYVLPSSFASDANRLWETQYERLLKQIRDEEQAKKQQQPPPQQPQPQPGPDGNPPSDPKSPDPQAPMPPKYDEGW